MTTRPALLSRLSVAALAACVLSGCVATLNPPPPVDMPSTSPPPIPSPAAALPATPTGGLFHAARYRPMFEDQRARLVGDMVTVMIVERVTATQSSTSSIDRENELSAGLTALPFLKNPSATLLARAQIGANSETGFSGRGATANNNNFTGSITTTVVDVLPNGHLVVTGEKQIGVNHNVDVLRFSGSVDPRNLQPGSLVSSTQVANVRVESRGRGQQAEAQSIGWLSRFFLNVMPF